LLAAALSFTRGSSNESVAGRPFLLGHKILADMTAEDDIVRVAAELAMLTQTVERMASQLKEVRLRAEIDRERVDIEHERIDVAVRELTEVTDRLQAAATALRRAT
jgi:molecular chaperone GrpE (heat shock protein)